MVYVVYKSEKPWSSAEVPKFFLDYDTNFCHESPVFLMLDSPAVTRIFSVFSKSVHYIYFYTVSCQTALAIVLLCLVCVLVQMLFFSHATWAVR